MTKPRDLTRRDLLASLAAAAAAGLVLVRPDRPECPKLAEKRGARWIGHL